MGVYVLHADTVQICHIFFDIRPIVVGYTVAHRIFVTKLPLGRSRLAILVEV